MAKKSAQTETKQNKKNASPTKTSELDSSAPKPQRGLAIGDNFGWTGKLPATLLFEHCQKQKWNKVVFDMRKTSKGFVGIVNLSWENPKTKELIQLKWSPDTDILAPRVNTNEARHFAATYAMHRLNHVKNLKMVLPTIFRDFWSEMETKRQELYKKDKKAHDRVYNANPFQVYLDEVAEKKLREKEKKAAQNNESKVRKPATNISLVIGSNVSAQSNSSKQKGFSTSLPLRKQPVKQYPISKKAWENAPFIDFPVSIRTELEASIMRHINWIEANSVASNQALTTTWCTQLIQLGFRNSHVQEAMSHTHTFLDALEWLLFHIPEDDLPEFFAKRDEDRNVSLKISTDIQTEYLIQRLSRFGFDKDVIMSTYNENNQDEHLTSIALTYKTISREPEWSNASEGDFETWIMEIEGISSIGTNKTEFSDHSKRSVMIVLNVANVASGMLSVKLFYPPGYPQTFPGVQLIVNDPSFQLANYIKLSIVRQLLEYLVENNFVGECMLYTIVEWLENNIDSIIRDPGPLVIQNFAKPKTLNGALKEKPLQRREKSGKVLFSRENDQLSQRYYEKRNSPLMEQSLRQRQKLPAWSKREDLVKAITSHKVTLITGETGSGKSTQVVQFILDYMCSQADFESTIICTQPRRISTIGLAERISEERLDKVGKETGYIIRGENKTSKETRLSFVTTGVLLRMLQSFLSSDLQTTSPIFRNLEYIFIDEVHERSVDSDFLLIILKNIAKKLPKLKIILMSATIDTSKFMTYFDTPVKHIHIEGRTYPIEDFYLENILSLLDFTIQTYDGQVIKPKADSHFFKTVNLNYELIARLCLHIDTKLSLENNKGSILVFLPGIMEINRCIKKIEELYSKSDKSCWCLPLHSALSSKDQTRVFKNPSTNSRKIVVSTNIAETSITIPDCVSVIDSGRSKSIFFDSKLGTSRLVENWCSQAEMSQRRGRSGRVRNGYCYHMYTQDVEKSALVQPIPEILRTRLENLYLVVKSMNVKNVPDFLNSGLDPPDIHSLKRARSLLFEIGALQDDTREEVLSNLGKYLSLIPTDLHSAKLMLLGCIFGCVEICVTIAAVISSGSPFTNNFDVKDEVRRIKKNFSKNQGDLIASALAYTEWQRQPNTQRKKFISDNFLSYMTLQDIQSTRAQYLSNLKEIGFLPLSYDLNQGTGYNKNGSNYTVIRAIITGSFTPQLARVQLPDTKYAQTLVGAIEVDPDAKLTKFWIRNERYISQCNDGGEIDERPARRAFVHPSSVLFSESGSGATLPDMEELTLEDGSIDEQKVREKFDMTPIVSSNTNAIHKSPFVAYGSANETNKLYLRDITPASTIGALLFGGRISYDISSHASANKRCPGIVLDSWIPVRTWCKNGVLIKRLRALLDRVIENRFTDPDTLVSDDEEILNIVMKVLATEIRQR